MEKVGIKGMQVKSVQSWLCLLASLAALLWFCLLYFHFVGLGVDSSVDSSTQLDSISFNNGVIAAANDGDEHNNPNDEGDRTLNSADNSVDNSTQLDPIASNNGVIATAAAEADDLKNEGNRKDAILDKEKANGADSAIKDEGKKKPTKKDPPNYPFMKALRTAENKSDPCGGKYVYVHDLPPRFNDDMVKHCKTLSIWTDMCKFTDHAGLGPPLDNAEGVFSKTGWHSTNQFAVDVIFANRMKQYECLTNDSSVAAAVFVPFFAGFDVARYLWGYNTSTRDSAALDLIEWLTARPEWKVMDGRDHFLVAGRITWDFRRRTDKDSDWGNKLLFLPAAKNMSMLVVEASPWNSNDFGIPYPTYFHPSRDEDVFSWQERMRSLERRHLFCFAGAPRPGKADSIRGQIIGQCKNSSACRLLECGLGESECRSPGSVMKMFQGSVFCLQPQGDSYTRRSAFDAMLAGCIPVFFHPASFYTQYVWHLPRDYNKYSVFIPEDDVREGKVNLEERLSQIPEGRVREMRETVIGLIPRLIYADPREKMETLKDAFDVAVGAVVDKVTRRRRDLVEGRKREEFDEVLSWKYDLSEDGEWIGPHEFDPYLRNKEAGEGGRGGGGESVGGRRNGLK